MNLRIQEIDETIKHLELEKAAIQSGCAHVFEPYTGTPKGLKTICIDDEKSCPFTYKKTCSECLAEVELSMREVCPTCHSSNVAVQPIDEEEWKNWRNSSRRTYYNYTNYKCQDCGQVIHYEFYDR